MWTAPPYAPPRAPLLGEPPSPRWDRARARSLAWPLSGPCPTNPSPHFTARSPQERLTPSPNRFQSESPLRGCPAPRPVRFQGGVSPRS